MTAWAYLDHAATSAVRPPAVAQAVAAYITDVGATPGRGGHQLALEAGRIVLRARQLVGRVLGYSGDPGRVVFTGSATLAINMALWGTLRAGDRLVVTALDHNAVLRPAARLATERGVHVELIAADADGNIDEAALRHALVGARLFTINAASNVLGTAVDVPRLSAIARAAGVLTLVDAAQLLGHAPFDAQSAAVDLVAFAGHKGLLGPQGVGGLWIRPGVEVRPALTGGTGGDSMMRDMPAALPDALEPGTLNGPGIAGLAAGVEVVLGEGVGRIHARLASLKSALHAGLAAIPAVQVLTPPGIDGVPIVTVRSRTMPAAELAARLDRDHGVLTRAGLHCAPEVHRLLGTAGTGAVRFSLGWSSSSEDVERAVEAAAAVHAAHPLPRGAR